MNSIQLHSSLLGVVLFFLIASNAHAQSSQVFTNSGTFTVPVGVTQITVECWGAGGGGGSANSNGTACGGGGGGAYAKSVVNVTAGNTYNVVVGTGGVADVSGGNSTFNSTTVIAAGGRGATYNTSIAGAGGTVAGSVGTIRYAGGNGANAVSFSGGGGGGAGSTGAGGNASGTTAGTGTSLYGGSGGTGVNSSSDGNNGFNYGGGGSGSFRSGGPSRTGGTGANGLVMISWVVCTPPTINGTAPASRCGTGTVILGATASAGTINWYAASSGGVSIGTGNSFTTPSISTTTTYYVDATNNDCTTTTRTAVTATINVIPLITGTTPGTRIGPGTVILGASSSAGTINWYNVLTGGTSLGTGTSFTTPVISTTTTYYVDATLNGCTTGTRTAVIATVDNPNADFRTIASGNWNALTTWERYNGSIWESLTGVSPLVPPNNINNNISIRTGHTVAVSANVEVDQCTIQAGGQITIETGQLLSITDGSGTDLMVYGNILNYGIIIPTGNIQFYN